MAGIQNTIIFSNGARLSTSSNQDMIDMQQTSTDVSFINFQGDPEGAVSCNPSSLIHDPISGQVRVKSSGTGNTGYAKLSPLPTAAVGQVLISNGPGVDPTFSATPVVSQITIANAPILATDGSNKAYVDSVASGFTFLSACQAASTTSLTVVYNNGVAGVGATLTNNGAQAAFAVDGYSASLNDRILIKDQSSTFQNGVYSVTTVGTGATNWVLTRTTDYDTPGQIVPGTMVAILNGTLNHNTFWAQVDTVTTVGTDPIQFTQFSQAPIMTTLHATLVGAANNAINSVGPSATAGQIFQSGGASADPSYSTATYPSTATGTGTLLRADGTNWVATTSTYPNTNAINTLLYASSANVMSALATANDGLLVTSNTGVPSILAGPGTTGNILQSNAAAAPSFSTATYPSTATGTGTLLRADGTNWVATTSTYPNTNAINTILYASSANVMSALATANDGLLVTSNTGVPSILAGPGTTGNILQSNAAAAPSFSTATYPSTATGTGTLLRADGTNWVATTSTYPNTNAINTLLYASSANVMAALATANDGILITSNTGVPSWLANGTTGQVLTATTGAPPSWSTASFPVTAGAVGTILRSDGTNWVATTSTYPNTNAINTLLYASSANVMAALSTANNGVLVTGNSGTPSILAGPGTNGNILQSNAAAAPTFSTAAYPSTATGTGTILRADGTNWVATTSTYPNTNAINTLLYASSANVMSALATANDGLLVTDNSGVPSILAGPGTNGNILQSNASAAPSFSTATYPSTTTINNILYSSANNVVGQITTGNDGVLITSHTGVPSLLANGTTGQVLTATTGAPPSWQPATGGSTVTFSVVTTNGALTTNTGTIANKAGLLSMSLPATSAVGDVLIFHNINTDAGLVITQATGQQIVLGIISSTLGATGTIASSKVGDSLTIRCTVANTIWRAESYVGNWTSA